MESDLIKINDWLKPLSWLYGLGVGVRNALFDLGILSSHSYDIPIINVGNITVGGTGKTPHVEYLIRILSKQYRTAVLSRGYKRRTKGYILASTDSTTDQIGDEPWLIKQKFPDVYVAVDGNRRRGINRLCNDAETKDVEVILLDDAYQHRYVRPGINMLLVDYHRMITDDWLLPAGRLREPVSSKKRADMVIVTKCPPDIRPMGFRVIQRALELKPHQRLFFSTLHYAPLCGVFSEKEKLIENLRSEGQHVLLLTGIGNPEQMEQDLRRYADNVTHLSFPDHHYFTAKDIRHINEVFQQIPSPRIIITTEKDVTRLISLEGLSEEVRQQAYVLPIKIEIMRKENTIFNEKITGYVLKNSRNSILAKRKNASTS